MGTLFNFINKETCYNNAGEYKLVAMRADFYDCLYNKLPFFFGQRRNGGKEKTINIFILYLLHRCFCLYILN